MARTTLLALLALTCAAATSHAAGLTDFRSTFYGGGEGGGRLQAVGADGSIWGAGTTDGGAYHRVYRRLPGVDSDWALTSSFNSGVGGWDGNGALAVDDQGNMVSAWRYVYSTELGVGYLPASGEPEAYVDVLGGVGNNGDYDMAVANGRAAVVFDKGCSTYVRERTGPGTWSDPELIVAVPSCIRTYPQVAMNDRGDITVVWLQVDTGPGPDRAAQRTKPFAGGWSDTQVMSAAAADDQNVTHSVDLDVAGDGTMVASWMRVAGYGPACDTGESVPLEDIDPDVYGPACGMGNSQGELGIGVRHPGESTFATQAVFHRKMSANLPPRTVVTASGAIGSLVERAGRQWLLVGDIDSTAWSAIHVGAPYQYQTLGVAGEQFLVQWSYYDGAINSNRNFLQVHDAEDGSVVTAPSLPDHGSPHHIYGSSRGEAVVHRSSDGKWAVWDNVGPEVGSTVSDTSVETNETVAFTATAEDAFSELAGDIEWELGDGTTATGGGVNHEYTSAGDFDVYATATDAEGNETRHQVAEVRVIVPDTLAPRINFTAPQSGQHFYQGQDVTVSFACIEDDPGDSGVKSCVGTSANGTKLDTSTLGQHSFKVTAIDNFDLKTETTVGYFVDEAPKDTTPPTAAITLRAAHYSVAENGFTVPANEPLAMEYSCADAGSVTSGIASCTGPVASGGAIPTSTVGFHKVTVLATDNVGLTASATMSYFVEPATQTVKERQQEVRSNIQNVPPAPPVNQLLGKTGVQVTFEGSAGFTTIGQVSGDVISTGGGNVISTGGGNVISTGGGNVISTGGGNVISTGGGNVISTGGGNFAGKSTTARARKPVRKPRPRKRRVLFATGGHTFLADGRAKVRIKLTKHGRKLVLAERAKAKKLRRAGKRVRPLVLKFTVVTGRADGKARAYATTRTIRIRL